MPNKTIITPYLTKKITKPQQNRKTNRKQRLEIRNKRRETNKVLLKIPVKS